MKLSDPIYRSLVAFIGAAIITLLPSCTGQDGRVNRVLDTADSLMSSHPDSALTQLEAMLPDTAVMGKPTQMRYYLLRTNARNKCDTVLGATDLSHIQLAAEHYDKDGTPNERMLAHYLAGRCYADMGEPPAALMEFHSASDAADTIQRNCDYSTLSRVYVQLADIFYMQNMPEYQEKALGKLLACTEHTGEYSVKAWAVNSLASNLEQAGRLQDALSLLYGGYTSLKMKGEDQLASQLLGLANSIRIDLGLYDGLEDSFQEYEQNSGFFSADGRIIEGKELYYVQKGRFYLAMGKKSLAERFFRRCLASSVSLENKYAASSSLLTMYKSAHATDSIAKYATLCASFSDSILRESNTKALVLQEGLYNYARIEQKMRVAQLKSSRLEVERMIWYGIAALAGLLLAAGFVFFIRHKRYEEQKTKLLMERYTLLLNDHAQTASELNQLNKLLSRGDTDVDDVEGEKHLNTVENEAMFSDDKEYSVITDIISSKERQLEQLREQIVALNSEIIKYQRKADSLNVIDIDKALAASPIVARLHSYLDATPYQKLTNADRQELRDMVRNTIPSFYQRLVLDSNLSLSKYDLCILYRLRFTPADIARLLGVTRSAVTQSRKKIYADIMKKPEEGNDFTDFINNIA